MFQIGEGRTIGGRKNIRSVGRPSCLFMDYRLQKPIRRHQNNDSAKRHSENRTNQQGSANGIRRHYSAIEGTLGGKDTHSYQRRTNRSTGAKKRHTRRIDSKVDAAFQFDIHFTNGRFRIEQRPIHQTQRANNGHTNVFKAPVERLERMESAKRKRIKE